MSYKKTAGLDRFTPEERWKTYNDAWVELFKTDPHFKRRTYGFWILIGILTIALSQFPVFPDNWTYNLLLLTFLIFCAMHACYTMQKYSNQRIGDILTQNELQNDQ